MFKPISENEATGKVKEVFDEIKSTRKITEVPNFWKYLANSPELLERIWNSTSQVMKPGALDGVTKELIYVAVSMTNSCEYCTKSHSAAAKKKGATEHTDNTGDAAHALTTGEKDARERFSSSEIPESDPSTSGA